jgi:tRNA(Ile)-lysidine synthase
LSGFSDIPGIVSAISFERSNNFVIPSDSSVAGLDSEKISFPLIIRGWEEGDRFYPLGMNRKKKLSDYFTDNKYSRIDKEKIRILESGGRIVWLIGDRIDNRFRITDSTKKVFLIKTDSKGESSNTLGKKH